MANVSATGYPVHPSYVPSSTNQPQGQANPPPVHNGQTAHTGSSVGSPAQPSPNPDRGQHVNTSA
jgi:hypothetical protein